MTSRFRTRVALVLLGALLPPGAAMAQHLRPEDGVLPNYDVRLASPALAPATDPDARAALGQLTADHGADVRLRRGHRGVRTIDAAGRPVALPAASTPVAGVLAFLERHHRAFGLEASDMRTLISPRQYSSDGDPLVHYEFVQVARGLRVFGGAVRAHLTRDGRLVQLSSTAAPTGDRQPDPTLQAEDAIDAAVGHVRPELGFRPQALQGPRGASRRTVVSRGGFVSDPEAELVWFPMADGLRLAWQVVLEPPGLPQKYDVLVDASTGALLYRRNRVLYADAVGRVIQSDAARSRDPKLADPYPLGAASPGPGDPPAGCPPVTNHERRSLVAPYRDPGSVLSAGGTLAGNNVHVFLGAPGVEGPSGTLQPDGSWSFDFAFGTPGSAATQLFFLSNFLHDFFYDLGFDEAAGNFQADNYGRGGRGGDSLFAVARADGRNNATFEPKPDGQNPVMSMFLWDGQGCWSEDVDADGVPDLDGSFDTDIAIHEYHHGVSWRLNPEFNGPEADAIGEGGSDFFAYSINGDTTLAEFAFPPYGIRQVNGRTYGSWWCWFDLYCEPHDNGEIWANVLWDLRERFRADQVQGSDDAAVSAVHQLYVDGLKLSPPSPTMLDLRDAILQADVLRHPSSDPGGSANHCRIWEVFALRGLGAAARDTADTNSYSVVEDFTMPAACPALPAPASVSLTATTPTASEAGPVPGVFAVTRTGDTTRSLTVFLSAPSGSAGEGVDYQTLPPSVVIPAGAASATVSVVPIDDLLVENSETVTLAAVAGPGYRVVAPASATITIVSDDVAPDLVVTAVGGPGMAGAGTAVAVTDTTRNQGTDAAEASVTRFWLSLNASLDAGDVAIGARLVPALGTGASSSGTASVTIPADTTSGYYYVIAQADADGTVSEVSEGNNTRYFLVRVGPDLVVSPFTAPSVAAAGGMLTVADTTKNQGAGDAGPSVTAFYLSTNTTLDAADVKLGERSVPALSAGASSGASISLMLPASMSAGTWYLLARADAAGAVAESIETNNVAMAQVRIGPDLIVSALTLPSATGAGATISVTDTIRNQGGGSTAASTVRFFLSVDINAGAGDVPLGSRAVPALAAGATSSGTTTVTVPADTPTGVYYVVAQADADSAVEETSEANNSSRVQVRVGPDLFVVTVTGPGIAAAGASVAVSETVKNQGGGTASASSTRLFLSLNSTLDASDAPLGSRAVPALAPGASSSGTTTVTLPETLAAGTYYVLAQADADNVVVETAETNNVAAAQFRVGPDLIVSALSATPTATGVGQTITLADTTKNNGGGASPATTTRFYLSTNAALDGDDVPLGGREVPALGAGVSHSASTPVAIPLDTPPGNWFVLALADADASVTETGESNNLRWTSVRVGPDLRVLSVAVPASVVAGATFSVTDTTRNDGGATAPPSVTRFYLSLNGTWDAGDLDLGGRSVPALAAGGGHVAATVLSVPAGTAPGRYYVIAKADGDGAVPEAYENNNTAWTALTVN